MHDGDAETALEHVDEALDNPLLADSASLARVRSRLSEVRGNLSFELRADLAAKLDTVNLLSNLVTRTRRRDVKELAIIRRVQGIKAEMTDLEREFYDEVEQAVTQYAFERDVSHRFLLASPQRMLTSSMAAALDHWRKSDATGNDSRQTNCESRTNRTPARLSLSPNSHKSLEGGGSRRQDTKYDLLATQLQTHLKVRKLCCFRHSNQRSTTWKAD